MEKETSLHSAQPVSLADSAVRALTRLLDGRPLDEAPLEVEIAAGPEQGYVYYVGFFTGGFDEHRQVEVRGNNYRLYLLKQDLPNLVGSVIHYDETKVGFRVENPNARADASDVLLGFRNPQPKPRLKLVGSRGQYAANDD